jgi:2-oxoacid:acceptor oxidoreductase delta subunit (pyruvate/2-ketoisovalerate family)
MPAFADEIEESLDEGIHFEFQIQPVRIIRENGRVAGLECVRTRLAGVDDSGRKRPVPVEGSNFTIDVDQVLVAIGETPEMSLTPLHVQQDWQSLTLGDVSTRESTGLFFSGDLVSPLRTVAHAIGSGKKAALSIDAFIRKENASEILEMMRVGDSGGVSVEKLLDAEYRILSRHVVSFDELNTAYFESMRRTDMRRSSVAKRIKDFSEVDAGLTRREARYEASRCFNCGTCNECENCYVFCPDISVLKRAKQMTHTINYDMCKGCGICFTECPRRAISMEEEKR